MRSNSANGAAKTKPSEPWHRGPLARLLLWFAAVAIAATVTQFIADGLGWRLDVRDESGGGRFLLLTLAAAAALMVLSSKHRQLQHFGMSISDNWAALYMGAFAGGAFCCMASYVLAVAAGQLTFNAPTLGWISAAITACLAFAFAPLQEIVFRAYLLTLARDRFGALWSVVLIALIFALTAQLHLDHLTASPSSRTLLVGAFLAGALLSMMRLFHGSILAPVGAATGWIFVQILMERTEAFVATGDKSLIPEWLCSSISSCASADPLRNPFAWCIFAAAIITYAIVAMRGGHRLALATQSSKSDLPLSFKKFHPFSSFVVMAPLDVLLPRLARVHFSIDPIYVPRLLTTLAISALNTVVSLPERLLLPHLLRHKKVPDPVIILGAHRSGTTHLHNLMALDPQFITPRTYQVINPTGFLFSSWLFLPFMWWFVPWKRPMDGMAFSLFAPQEDEFAITCCSRLSPYWGIVFPRESEPYERYLVAEGFEAAERAAWKANLLTFLRKLCVFSGSRPLLKNPCNTGRIEMLLELFPAAKFVHIHRNPYDVYLSVVHTARDGLSLYQFQDPPRSPEAQEARLLDQYVAIEERFYAKIAQLPPHQMADVRFEDLERDPIGQIEQIYRRLGMTVTANFRARMLSYLQSIAGYQKNTFTPIAEDRDREVHEKLAPLFKRWDYLMR